MVRRYGLLAGLIGLLIGMLTAPAQALDVNPEQALIGPVRYTETNGVQDPVYGTPLLAIADAFASNPVTGDDTIVMTLSGFPTANATIWLRKTNGIFPAAGATADDSLNFTHPSTTPARISSVPWFTLVNGSNVDDTVLRTNIAVNAPGTYTGSLIVYEGTANTMSPATIVQTTSFTFTTAGAPTKMVLSRSQVDVVADPGDYEDVFVSMLDAKGKPTQVGIADTIAVESSSTTVATASPAIVTAADFDDTLPAALGAAPVYVAGSSGAGSATVTFTPRGTLPSSGVTAQSVAVTSVPLTTKSPGPFAITYPFDQVVEDRASTDDTLIYSVNDAFVTDVITRTTGATPNSGVIVYVTTNSSNWVGLEAYDDPTQVTTLPNGVTNIPIVLRADATGQVRLFLRWQSVSDGGRITLRVGTGSNTRWTVINDVDPQLSPTTTPAGRVLAKTGEPIEFTVKLTDNFGNAYSGYLVTGRAFASSGFPAGALGRSAPTDAEGVTTLTIDPPDDTYVGNARINFTTTLPSGLPYPALSPAQVLVTYSATGNPTSLTVVQGQSTPTPIGPTSTLTTYPHVVVPYTGEASTADGTPGTWSVATASGAANGTMAAFMPNVTPATSVTVTADPDVKLTTYTSEGWDAGESTLSVDSGTSVYAFSTKVGVHRVTFTVGSLTTTALFKVSTAPAAAYSIAATPAQQNIGVGAIGAITISVTDAFGNQVPRTTNANGGVTVTASGQVLLTGLDTSATVTTDDSGQASLAVITSKAVGQASLTAVPFAATTIAAWQPDYEIPTGFPDPVLEAVAKIQVVGPQSAPTISIVGGRTKVNGRSGIEVDGTINNFDDSPTLTPWVKLAGQTKYTAGTAVITPAADGTFSWSRRTGKKAYVYVATADRAVVSNSVTIP